MNAVEIEQAVSELVEQNFDAAEFALAFLRAFGAKDTTIKRLRNGETNKSDLGGVLQTGNIHIKVAEPGAVAAAFEALKASPATKRFKARFVLATDGVELYAEDLTSDEAPVICALADFPNHFGSFLALAGISTVKQVRESTFDIRATSRLNRLYVELLKDNPDWGTAARRPDMNHFMARLIFCFFAEDTDIFNGKRLFTATVEQMTERDGNDTHAVIGAIFTAMNTPTQHNGAPDGRYRREAGLRPWADAFPYVNGGLFSGSTDVPRFSRIARSYLINIGSLDWTRINPDIFGSMIQAVADDEERGALGMHYTSVPNILKVLNPLFLDDLREKLDEAGDNARKLLNLRNRMARIRVFDPACGSGNFLVIAYKEMRGLEAEINRRRGEQGRKSDIPLTNFRGIELRHFPAEIARLALIIAEYQADVVFRGQKEALAAFLPLDQENWIVQGNALRLDWLSVCPPTGTGVKHRADDLFETPLDQAQIDFENEGGETYICGNPPYIWANNQTAEQKSDVLQLQAPFGTRFRGLDYVSGWFYKFSIYSRDTNSNAAFVATNSITQGEQVDPLWSGLLGDGCIISFAHRSFKWQNLAKSNASVSVVIIGLSRSTTKPRRLFDSTDWKRVENISPYLLDMADIWIRPSSAPLNGLKPMLKGSQPTDGGGLILTQSEAKRLAARELGASAFIRGYVGSDEITSGRVRYCLWIEDGEVQEAEAIPAIAERLSMVRRSRLGSTKAQTKEFAALPHRFTERRRTEEDFVALPCVSSENRAYLSPVLLSNLSVISNRCFGSYGVPIWYISLLSSRVHECWCEATSGKLETRLN
jgi:hypothetical protein